MTETHDIVIIGNGILGLTLARALRIEDPSAKVAVIGPPSRPGSATMAAGAMLALWGEIEIGQFNDPDLALRFTIPERGVARWDSFAQSLTEESGIHIPVNWGTYVLNSPAGNQLEDRSFDYMVEALNYRKIPVEIFRAHELPFLEARNHLRPFKVAKIPDGSVNPHIVIRALDTILDRDNSVKRYNFLATQLTNEKNLHTVTLEDGTTVGAKIIVLANGSYAQDLVDQVPDLQASVPRLIYNAGTGVDAAFRQFSYDQQMVPQALTDMTNVVRSLDRGGACGIHIVPHGDNRFYLGASSGSMFEPFEGSTLHGLHAILGSAEQEINVGFFKSVVTPRQTGFRPLSIDAFPLLGESCVDGIWFANGMKRDGFTSSPYISSALASQILHGRSDLPERFQPSRKLISYRRRRQAVDIAYLGAMVADYSHGLSLPGHRYAAWHGMQRAQIEAMYDKRGIKEFGVHPEILYFYPDDQTYAKVNHPREIE